MRFKHLLPLLITSLCCMGETNKPARDYKMIDVQNGLTYKLLDIGTTSFTFFVEWPLDTEFDEGGWLDLFGKFHIDSGWNPVFSTQVDPTQGKVTLEIPYNWLIWCNFESERAKFEQKAFFQFSVSPPDDMGWLPSREEIEEELAKIRAEREGMVKPPPAENESSGGIPAVESGGGFQPSGQADTTGATAGSRRYLWLCTGIALALCGVFYFLRKKTNH